MFSFDHVAIGAEHLEKTIEFYKKLGFEPYGEYRDDDSDYVMLKMGNIILEIFHYRENDPLPEHAKDWAEDLKTVGTKHFGLNVKDIDVAKKWIEDNKLYDGEIIMHEGRMGTRYFFINDPNEIAIEIIEER